jgi:TRAP-type mannitol/chloroaromatic compound transport system substrate-binding protein
MKRREFLKQAGLGVAAGTAATVAAPAMSQAPAQAQPTITWRMPASWPKSLDNLFGGAEFVAKRVAELTEGKFQIRVFAAGEIVPGLQVLDAVQAGTVELGHTVMYYYVGKDPAWALVSEAPFGMNTRQKSAYWYSGGGAEVCAPLFKDYGCVAIPCGTTCTQMGGWYRKEIKTVADFKGLKFRIGGLAGQVLVKLGVVPQQLAGGDIYPALEKGTIDAAEWVGPYDDEKLGFNKVAPYYYYPAWWEGGTMLHVIVNEKKWNELPKHYQVALEAACGEAYTRMAANYDAKNPAALRRLIASGTKLRPFSKAIMEACEKATFELYAELEAKSAHWKRMYSTWKKFRDEEIFWFRVAENSFDNYMLNSKYASAAAEATSGGSAKAAAKKS